MTQIPTISPEHWYETVRMSDGVTLIHEPWIKPFFRCNMWHIRGRDRDMIFDTGLGHVPLRKSVSLLVDRPIVCVGSHTHFDHVGAHHEFSDRCIHCAEAEILVDPRNEWTLAHLYANEDMFDGKPLGWDTASYQVKAAPANRLLDDGDVIDLGDRAFEVIHTPGHSPGGIALWEKKTGILLSGDIVYDGPLVDTTFHGNLDHYEASVRRLAALPVEVVHGGHFQSYGAQRHRAIIDEYLLGRRLPGCHLQPGVLAAA